MNLKNEIGTFLSAKEDTVINPIDAPENIENLKKVSRNILDEFSIIAKQNDTHILPAPSTKETVRVLRRNGDNSLQTASSRRICYYTKK